MIHSVGALLQKGQRVDVVQHRAMDTCSSLEEMSSVVELEQDLTSLHQPQCVVLLLTALAHE